MRRHQDALPRLKPIPHSRPKWPHGGSRISRYGNGEFARARNDMDVHGVKMFQHGGIVNVLGRQVGDIVFALFLQEGKPLFSHALLYPQSLSMEMSNFSNSFPRSHANSGASISAQDRVSGNSEVVRDPAHANQP